MAYYKNRPIIIKDNPGIIYQLSDEEIQKYQTVTIKHIGAVLDINFSNKEDTKMVEKLKAYLAELEAKKAELINGDASAEINAKTEEFREALIKEIAAARAEQVAKIDSDINCINGLIAREEALVEEVKEAEVVTEDTTVTE